jgi:hypothetical protein
MRSSDVPPKLPRSGGAFLRRTHYSYLSPGPGNSTQRAAGYAASMQKAPSRITGPFGRSSVGGECSLTPHRFLNSSLSFGSRRKWGGWISPITRAFSQVGEACHEMAVIHRQNFGRDRLATSRPGGRFMKRLTSAELFAPPGIRRKDQKARLERAKLVVVAARDRAVETAQQRAVPSMKRFPTVLQRRRLAERLSANS